MDNVINLKDELPEKMLRAKDMSQIFINTSQATYDNWVRMGLIHRYKIGGGVYYKLSEVKLMIENAKEYQRVG